MARTYTYCQTLEREIKIIYGSFVVGATGAVGTIKGGFTITRNSAGNYTVVYPDLYNRLLFSAWGFVNNSGGSGVASVEIDSNPATLQSNFNTNGSYVIQFYDYTGAAVDAASGSVFTFVAHVRLSDVNIGND